MPDLVPMELHLLISDDEIGDVWLIQTRRQRLEFRLTPTGLIRVMREPVKGLHPAVAELPAAPTPGGGPIKNPNS